MIPPQLRVEGFKFIKIRSDNKKVPLESDWTNTANYEYNNDSIQQWISQGNNYGVATGFGNLIVLDSDDIELKNIIEKEFPKTFTVRTGGGGFHYYYICPDQDKIVIENGRHLGELQSKGQQVIGPGSVHPNGKLYEIVEDRDIVELPKRFIELLPKNEYNKKNTPSHTTGNTFNLDVTDVIPLTGLTKKGSGEYQGAHPLHGSEKGMNFTVNPSKNVWHCFRHNCGGGAIDWIAMEEGIIQCGQTLEKPQLVKAIEIAKSKYGLTDNLEEKKKQETHKENYMIKAEILEAISDKNRSKATELMVEEIHQREHIYSIRDDEKSEMWIYHRGIYLPNGESAIKEFCRDIMGENISSTYVNQVVFKVQIDTFIDQKEFFDNNIKDEVVVENGILNILTKELSPWDAEKIFFTKLPITYDISQNCNHVQQFFADILADPENDIKIIQELFGYLLYKEYNIERAMMFIGTGRNGKGKTLDLMKRFIGPENCASVSLQDLESKPFTRSNLHKKLANLSGDIDERGLRYTGSFKQLTGRDLITADRKFKTSIYFENYAKMCFAANQLPTTSDLSDGFFMRWILLEFPYRFETQETIDGISDAKELANIKLRDPDIIKKIITPEELSGMLNWAIEGLERLQKNKDFTYNKTFHDVKTMWLRMSDSFTAFCMDNMEKQYGSQIAKSEIRHCYNVYCDKHDLKACNDKEIKEILTTQYGVWDKRIRLDDNFDWFWVGIHFKKVVNPQNSLL